MDCGAGICLIDPLFPDNEKCVCNPNAVITSAGHCRGKQFLFIKLTLVGLCFIFQKIEQKVVGDGCNLVVKD